MVASYQPFIMLATEATAQNGIMATSATKKSLS